MVEYRNTVYLPAMEEYNQRIVRWEIEELDNSEEFLIGKDPVLLHSEQPIIKVCQDESPVNPYDGVHQTWVHEESIPFFGKRGGGGRMISEYITVKGPLQLPAETLIEE